MATITIGDKVCSFEGSQTILQVALDNDIEIPHYCYHPGLTVVASCRICLAEVAQPNPRNDNKLEKIPKLVPTCQHMAVDGAEVYLDSETTVANQKAIMEYLLINHPLDCPVCDQAGECFLQDYSYDYGRASSRFEEDKVKQPKKDIGEHILLYSDRCIMCTRCVRFTREVSGEGELSVQGRGRFEEIDVFPGKPLDNELSGNVVDICPVGALLDKDFLFEQRVWNLKSTPSIDPVTCSGDNIWIDHNMGQIWRVKPRENMDVNTWWISNEIRYGWKFVHNQDRLDRPKHKAQGTLEVAKWHEALGSAAAGLAKAAASGGRVALMVSPMIACEEAYLLGQAARQIDPEAILGVGPVPVDGQNKTFPGGYTIYAEKAPNARGVRRALERVDGSAPLEFEAFVDASKDAGALIATGNYPNDWVTRDFAAACRGKYLVLIDTLPTLLADEADVILPSATWAEKEGTFENVDGRLQAFDRAIALKEFVRAEGQIALDLMAMISGDDPTPYRAADARAIMGGAFVEHIHLPVSEDIRENDMQFVEL